MPRVIEPPLKRPPKPVEAAPYLFSGEAPGTSVHDPASGSEVFDAVWLVQIELPSVSVMLLSESVGLLPLMSKATPVSALP